VIVCQRGSTGGFPRWQEGEHRRVQRQAALLDQLQHRDGGDCLGHAREHEASLRLHALARRHVGQPVAARQNEPPAAGHGERCTRDAGALEDVLDQGIEALETRAGRAGGWLVRGPLQRRGRDAAAEPGLPAGDEGQGRQGDGEAPLAGNARC
jgi:hypothetical protein